MGAAAQKIKTYYYKNDGNYGKTRLLIKHYIFVVNNLASSQKREKPKQPRNEKL